MKRIMIVANHKDEYMKLARALEKVFRVQFCSDDVHEFMAMVDIVKPDAILVPVKKNEVVDSSIFSSLSLKYSEIPTFTIADDTLKKRYLRYYSLDQFSNFSSNLSEEMILDRMKWVLRVDETAEDEDSIGNDAERRRKVLVVDDNAATLRSIKAMLEEWYDVTIVPSAAQMMVALSKNVPDIILLDYEMPVTDGKQALQFMRSELEYQNIPVIFLTGVNDREAIQSVAPLAPKGYLLKPPTREKLREAIEKVMWGNR